jgi:hypothetical protein
MIGLRVICIKGEALNSKLKVGKLFTVRDVSYNKDKSNKYYVVVCDNDEVAGWVSSNNFKPLSELREEKLQDLGII